MGVNSKTIFETNYEVRVLESDGDVRCIAAKADHYDLARAAFVAAAKCYTYARIVLQNGARIVGEVETGAYDHQTQTVAVVKYSAVFPAAKQSGP
jgi:hypothetical protein